MGSNRIWWYLVVSRAEERHLAESLEHGKRLKVRERASQSAKDASERQQCWWATMLVGDYVGGQGYVGGLSGKAVRLSTGRSTSASPQSHLNLSSISISVEPQYQCRLNLSSISTSALSRSQLYLLLSSISISAQSRTSASALSQPRRCSSVPRLHHQPRIPQPRIPQPRIPQPRIPRPRIPRPRIPRPRILRAGLRSWLGRSPRPALSPAASFVRGPTPVYRHQRRSDPRSHR